MVILCTVFNEQLFDLLPIPDAAGGDPRGRPLYSDAALSYYNVADSSHSRNLRDTPQELSRTPSIGASVAPSNSMPKVPNGLPQRPLSRVPRLVIRRKP
jgi:hypothetical protein